MLWQVSGSDASGSILDCSETADLSNASDGSSDKIVLCDPADVTTIDGVVSTQLEFRFYADLKTVRTRLLLTNNSENSIEGLRLKNYFNAYQDNSTQVYASSSSAPDFTDPMTGVSTVVAASDLRWVTDDRFDDSGAPVVQYAVGRENSRVLPTDDASVNMVSGGQGGPRGSAEDDTNTYFKVPALAPGETVEFVIMAQVYLVIPSLLLNGLGWQVATKTADEAAWADTTIDSDALVFAGIADTSSVLNWNVVSAPQLPDTGNDGAGFASIAAALLLLGAGAIVIRRRLRS